MQMNFWVNLAGKLLFSKYRNTTGKLVFKDGSFDSCQKGKIILGELGSDSFHFVSLLE